MINTVLLAAITGMLIGKWIIEPIIDILKQRRKK
jgi:flagellar motor component MotA